MGIPACRAAWIVALRSAARCCAGSPATSASTTSTICPAGCRITGCRKCCRDYPELRDIGRITLLESLRCVKLVLWDENRRKLVSFREARLTA